MIDTAHIAPYETGPQSNPILFGVALALVELFPIAVSRIPEVPLPIGADTPVTDRSADEAAQVAA